MLITTYDYDLSSLDMKDFLSDYKQNCSPEKLSGLLFFDSGCVVNHEKRTYYLINEPYSGT